MAGPPSGGPFGWVRMSQVTSAEIARALKASEGDELIALLERYGGDSRAQVQRACERAKRRMLAQEEERLRVAKLYETQLELGGPGLVVGVDEVGRGAALRVCRSASA